MRQFVLAIDQGTTGSTVALVDDQGVLCSSVNHEFPQYFPKPGWVEHDPEEIWSSVLKGIRKILAQKLCKPTQIASIGITNQRETALLWRRDTGEAVHNAIVWQCRRTADQCEQLKRDGVEKQVQRTTGLVLDPYFSASKYAWLLQNGKGARRLAQRGLLAAGTIDSFLLWRLSGGTLHATEIGNASRTSLMSLRSGRWDPAMCELFGVPQSILPEILPSSGPMTETLGVPGLPDGIPITGIAGDQQAALFGQACFKVGEAKCTFGTGSFILMNTGDSLLRSRSGLLTTVAWQLAGEKKPSYALEGGAFVCGAAVQWLRDELQIIKRAGDIEALAASVDDHGGVEFVPALTGLGAPYWDPHARGTLAGLTRGSSRGHIARATLDAMALQNADILSAMEKDLGKRMLPLRVDGGAAANDLLMQIQANVLNRKIVRPAQIETTVIGAAYLAGLGVGLWSNTRELKKLWQAEREFKVAMSAKARSVRLESWRKALRQTMTS
ncbi:MAG: glycerol kinase [Halieaceae bacterium]|jgi:glycerol kinase